MSGKHILLLGASIRAAAQSCLRAGFTCHGADLFADVDVQRLGPISKIDDYPRQLLEVARRMERCPWMYTGGLENYPELITAISQRHDLWGMRGEALRRVRDPILLHQVLQESQLPTPLTELDSSRCSPATIWLRKPIKSCGGMDISLHSPVKSSHNKVADGKHCFQQLIDGFPVAALFVANCGRVRLLGVTRQIIGQPWTGAGRFQYAGSIGPLTLADDCTKQIARIGSILSQEFSLRGLFGVDGVLRDDLFYTVEVNPRYTASVEVLERAGLGAAIKLHAGCFDGSRLTDDATIEPSVESNPLNGKAIVFANANAKVGAAFGRFVAESNQPDQLPNLADIPQSGSIITPSRPVATVFAQGRDVPQVLQMLRERSSQLLRSLEST